MGKDKTMMKTLSWAGVLWLLTASAALAQGEALEGRIAALAAPLKLEVGVSLRVIEDGRAVSLNGDRRCPMQSVFKFPLALAALRQVDGGWLALEQEIAILPGDLLPSTWSPIRQKHPKGVKLPLAEVIAYTVAQSDNNGCDVLLRLLGGPAKVNDFIHGLGIKDMVIQVNEAQMHRDWQAQFANWTTPRAATRLLQLFYEGKVLSPTSTAFLLKVMRETRTGDKRIKGGLPPGTPVAHKTGTSGVKDGVRAAVNDVGLITLPDGRHLAIAVLVADSREDSAASEKLVAEIARAAYGHFSGAGKRSRAD